MSRRGMRATTWLVLGIILLSAAALGGCATDPQSAAALTLGGMLGLQFGAMALTGSTLEVQIDMYAPTPDQYAGMRLDHPFALTTLLDAPRSAGDADLLGRATPKDILAISVRLQPIMDSLKKTAERLHESARQAGSLGDGGPHVAATFTLQANHITTAFAAWTAFMNDLNANLDRLGQAGVLDKLTSDLLALRVRLHRVAAFEGVTPEYIGFMKARLFAALPQVGHPLTDTVTAQTLAALLDVKDDPKATGAERIAAVLNAVRGPLASPGANRVGTDEMFQLLGLSIDSATLLALPSREAIVEWLTKGPHVIVALAPQPPAACTGAAAPVAARGCGAAGRDTITLTVDRATNDVNLGLISNEIQQVLQAAARGLGTITDPANEGRWRLNAAHAKSDAGPGNHNSVIYFENMGLPIVKSSTFDPTKFVVAQGTLFRHFFTGAVAAFGVPLPASAGGAGAADLQSSNVIATRARIINAEKAAAAARQKIIDALKGSIDQQQKIKDGDWATKSADLVKAAQKALQDAAGQLEAVAGTN